MKTLISRNSKNRRHPNVNQDLLHTRENADTI